MSQPFIAEVRIFAGNFAPRGWAFCNGQLLPIAQNTALFSLVGTTFGGDGRTTLGLPNLQGRAPMHAGRGAGLTPRRLGESGGTDQVSLSLNQMPNHTHQLFGSEEDDDSTLPENNAYGVLSFVYREPAGATLVDMSTAPSTESLVPQGGGQSHNNLQPYLVMPFIIALQGIYPTRS